MWWLIGGVVLFLLVFGQRDTMPDAQNDPELDDRGFHPRTQERDDE